MEVNGGFKWAKLNRSSIKTQCLMFMVVRNVSDVLTLEKSICWSGQVGL